MPGMKYDKHGRNAMVPSIHGGYRKRKPIPGRQLFSWEKKRNEAWFQAWKARQESRRLLVVGWFEQFDLTSSGKLDRAELLMLLTHLNPHAPPDDKALDLLITQATELKTRSLHLRGDPMGSVAFNDTLAVVEAYTAYQMASAAFDACGGSGVLQLSDLPDLLRRAHEDDDDDDGGGRSQSAIRSAALTLTLALALTLTLHCR